jgi:hypothetical protein
VLDFEQLLAEGVYAYLIHYMDLVELAIVSEGRAKAGDDEDGDEDAPQFSLVTGTYRHPRQFGGQ